MKYKIQIFVLAIGIINFSCDQGELKISNELKGTWEWHSACGGFAGCLYAKDYASEDQYKIVIDDFTIRTIENNGNTTRAYYQIRNTSTQGSSRIFEIELDDGTIYSASVSGKFLTEDNESGLPVTITYKRSKFWCC